MVMGDMSIMVANNYFFTNFKSVEKGISERISVIAIFMA